MGRQRFRNYDVDEDGHIKTSVEIVQNPDDLLKSKKQNRSFPAGFRSMRIYGGERGVGGVGWSELEAFCIDHNVCISICTFS